MGETVQHDVGRAGEVLCRRKAARLAPGVEAFLQALRPLHYLGPLEPVADRAGVELQEYAFAELLDGRKPVGIDRQGRAVNRQPDFLDVAIGGQWCRLEAGETVLAADLAKAVHRYDGGDAAEIVRRALPPDRLGQRLRMQERIGPILSDHRLT